MAATRAYQAPRTPLEASLAQVWQEVLAAEAIGIHDHFIERGGDSILAIQVVSRAAARGIAFSPRDLFTNPTIAELAAVARPAPLPEAAAEQDLGEYDLDRIVAELEGGEK